jgi:hypothetical protein
MEFSLVYFQGGIYLRISENGKLRRTFVLEDRASKNRILNNGIIIHFIKHHFVCCFKRAWSVEVRKQRVSGDGSMRRIFRYMRDEEHRGL